MIDEHSAIISRATYSQFESVLEAVPSFSHDVSKLNGV